MNIAHILAKPLLAITPDKEINYKPWHQVGLGGLMTGATVGSARLFGTPWKATIPLAAGSLAMGAGILPLHNALVKYKREQQLKKAEKAILEHLFPKNDIGSEIQEMLLSKQAGFADKATSLVGKGIWRGMKAIGGGLLPTPSSASVGRKIFGGAVKTTALGLGAAGTFATVNNLKNKQSYNYNTNLRNNILAGNINPAELNSSEAQEIKRIGWR
jgi:hypothetical protein